MLSDAFVFLMEKLGFDMIEDRGALAVFSSAYPAGQPHKGKE